MIFIPVTHCDFGGFGNIWKRGDISFRALEGVPLVMSTLEVFKKKQENNSEKKHKTLKVVLYPSHVDIIFHTSMTICAA